MEFALIVLVTLGADDASAIEVNRYRTPTDCQFQARSMSNHASNTARMFIGGTERSITPAYVCVPVPKRK